jgi:phosphate transport system permease protein
VGEGAVLPIIPLFARERGASVAAAALIVGIRALGTLLLDLPSGVVVSRYGDKGAMVAGTALVAIPIGIGGTIYLAEYARDTWLTRCIRLAIVNLAGIPSIVYGLFGLGLFVLFMQMGTSIVAGALTLAIMTLPVVISTAEEALRAVPTEFRTVNASLGGSRWQAICNIVLPQALPGIITGIILGLLRAAGETAPILFTVAAFFLPSLPHSPFDQTMALPYHLYVISTQVPGMPEKLQYGTALVLLGLVLSMNIVASVIRSHFRRKRQW